MTVPVFHLPPALTSASSSLPLSLGLGDHELPVARRVPHGLQHDADVVPDGELVVELVGRASRLDIRVELHQTDREWAGERMGHHAVKNLLHALLDGRVEHVQHLDQLGHQVGVVEEGRRAAEHQQPDQGGVVQVVPHQCWSVPGVGQGGGGSLECWNT